MGGANLRKLEGGVKILNFQRPLKLAPVYRDSKENPQFGRQKTKSSRDNFWGEFPPPSRVQYVLTPPPYPGLRETAIFKNLLIGLS